MKKYLELSLIMTTGLLVSCTREGYRGLQGPGGMGRMMHYGYGGIVIWIIILLIIGLLIYFFTQVRKIKGQTSTQNENHLDILKKRYAKGEIEKDEYQRIKKDLEG